MLNKNEVLYIKDQAMLDEVKKLIEGSRQHNMYLSESVNCNLNYLQCMNGEYIMSLKTRNNKEITFEEFKSGFAQNFSYKLDNKESFTQFFSAIQMDIEQGKNFVELHPYNVVELKEKASFKETTFDHMVSLVKDHQKKCLQIQAENYLEVEQEIKTLQEKLNVATLARDTILKDVKRLLGTRPYPFALIQPEELIVFTNNHISKEKNIL